MMFEIDSEQLISLVEARPTLWDNTLDIYKDRNATRNAWREICVELKPDFENLEDKEKNAFGKEVLRRWTNLRDAFSKSRKKIKDSKTSGAGQLKRKNYVFDDQLQFLNKLYESRETEDSVETRLESGSREEQDVNDETSQIPTDISEEDITTGPAVTNKRRLTDNQKNLGPRKHRKPDELELRMLKALENEKPNAHMSFFQGVIPHLEKFDASEILQFQMGVLQLISTINEKKRAQQPLQVLTSYPGFAMQSPQFSSRVPPVTCMPSQYSYQHSQLPTQPFVSHSSPYGFYTTTSSLSTVPENCQEVIRQQASASTQQSSTSIHQSSSSRQQASVRMQQASTCMQQSSTSTQQASTSKQQLTPFLYKDLMFIDHSDDSVISPGSSSTIDFADN